MADITDVEQAILDLLAEAIYPAGTALPSAIIDPRSGNPVPTKLFRGWPPPAGLQSDMRAGTINVNIYRTGVGHSTTRYTPKWQTVRIAPATVTLTVSGDTVTVGGTPAAGQNATVVADGVGYVHAVQADDTLADIATALADQIGNGASSTGPVLTISGATTIGATVGTLGTSIKEVSRQTRVLQVNIWAPTPAIRDAAAKLLVPVLRDTIRLAMPDGGGARLMTAGDGDDDDGDQKEQLFRRLIPVPVEYATTLVSQDPTVTALTINTTAADGTPVNSFTITQGTAL